MQALLFFMLMATTSAAIKDADLCEEAEMKRWTTDWGLILMMDLFFLIGELHNSL